jgi:lysophospholipase L1-like esterase
MTKTNRILITVVLTLLTAWSCASVDPIAPEPVNTGSVSFARFHVIGGSITAGVQNGGLVEGFQKGAWPAVVGQAAQKSAIALPTITENGIPQTIYVANFAPVTIDTLERLGRPSNVGYPGFYNNMGIPSATVHQLVYQRPMAPSPDPTYNPFFEIVLRDSTLLGGAATATAQMVAAQPTLALIWAGVNDVLRSAAAGTDLALTPPGQFETDYRVMLDVILGGADDVVAANIHNVLASPYFTTLPPVVIDPATGQPVLIAGQMVPLLWDNGGTVEDVPLNSLITLPASSLMKQGIGIPAALGGTGEGLPGSVVLLESEYTQIGLAIGQYNTIIDSLCTNRGVPVVDLDVAFERWFTQGYDMRGETYTTDYISGGFFSIDGLHPSVIGHYAIALEFIGVINSSFGAAIPAPLLPLGPFRDPSLGAAGAAAAAASIEPAEWRGTWLSVGSRYLSELEH